MALSPDATAVIASPFKPESPQFALSLAELETALNDDADFPEVRASELADTLCYVSWR